MNVKEIWKQTLDFLEGTLKQSIFMKFKEDIEPVFFKNDEFVLLIEDEFTQDMFFGRINDFKNAAFSALGKDISFRVISSLDDIHNKQTSSSSNNLIKNNLNPQYTFKSFVVGNSNRFAHAVCEGVAENPATRYNPLFLYGGVGLGKTHLMHAIGNQILEKNPNAKIIYLSTETFMNDMINSIKDGSNKEFRDKYRSVDVLLIDDIQFIQSKESTQEEFFHTFNALHNDNKQIVISSDRPPKEIQTLEDRLRSRFEQGLITDIQPPDYETRVAILLKKSQSSNVNIPDEVIDYVAKNINSNIRELEGAITRICALADLYKKEITLEVAQDALKTLLSDSKKEITIDDIKEKVSSYFGLQDNEINQDTRMQPIAYARQVAMYLCKTLIKNITYIQIVTSFGKKDHSTAIHAIKKVQKDINDSKETKDKINNIIDDLKNNSH